MERATWPQLVNSKEIIVKPGDIVALTEFVEAACLKGLALPLEQSGLVRLGL
jgi:hypothetical protein